MTGSSRASTTSRASDGRPAYGLAGERSAAETACRAALAWFFADRGPFEQRLAAGPFYCDPARVGAFAVDRVELAAGTDAALFRLLVTLSMYQALRDVVIMRQQAAMPAAGVRPLVDVRVVGRAIGRHACTALADGRALLALCDVKKEAGEVDCVRHPGARCPVKHATRAFHRMGDMGKLPASAWFELWQGGGIGRALSTVCAEVADPSARAAQMVVRVARVHRVGTKLATLFVSALSTPALAPGLTPWAPSLDGHQLVVIDTNVARAIDALSPAGVATTYARRAEWVRAQAARIDLRAWSAELPRHSPRLLQEALYAFGSRSNRVGSDDPCAGAGATRPCRACAPALCPFA